MTIQIEEWEIKIESKIRTLANHFNKKTANYFSESDIHSYLYYVFYRDKDFSRQYPIQDQAQKTVLIHREYPTFFKYKKTIPLIPNEKDGKRGHYDFVVLNPEFIETQKIEIVTNKYYRKLHSSHVPKPLLAVIEFKFIVRKLDQDMFKEIKMDFQKLRYSIPYTYRAFFLLFSLKNAIDKYREEIKKLEQEYSKIKVYLIEV